MKNTILCVDDEIDNLEALERLFRPKYKVLKAHSGPEALTILDQHPEEIVLIITDQRMPQMTGVDFLKKSIETKPLITRLLLTGYSDLESVIDAVNSGEIYRYINKPWDPVDFMATVDEGVQKYLLQKEIRQKNDELQTALSELQFLDKAKNNFMILINHELKTPLTSILSFSELLSETHLNEEQELCTSRIKKSAEKLKTLIDDTLIVVSSEMKHLKMKVQPFLCNSLHPLLTKDMEQLMKQRRQRLEFEWTDKKIVGDSQYVLMILQRLLHNAIKFGREDAPIQIKVELREFHRCEFSITNHGTPIPPDVIEKIFKPFFIDENVMNHSTGTGLGLTLCQTLLKAHGSLLKIENPLQSDGSTMVQVKFELPYI